MKPYPNSPLLYEKEFSIIINEIATPIENSTLYYFDYDQRSHSINMEFPHFHIFYEMMILLSPKAYHFVNGKRYNLIANDLVLLAPSILHQSQYLPGAPSDRIIIGFKLPPQSSTAPDGYQEILSVFHGPLPVFRFHLEEQRLLYQKLNELIILSQNTTEPAVRRLMIHTKFTEFLYTLYELREHNCYVPDTITGTSEKIYSITSYIHTHYQQELSLTDLAERFYLSPCYLSHSFKKVTGYTIVQYIQLTRIKNAQYLLLNSNTKITKIAEDTGFSSFSQFNRIFHKICGMSPSDYRQSSPGSSYLPH